MLFPQDHIGLDPSIPGKIGPGKLCGLIVRKSIVHITVRFQVGIADIQAEAVLDQSRAGLYRIDPCIVGPEGAADFRICLPGRGLCLQIDRGPKGRSAIGGRAYATLYLYTAQRTRK